MIHLPMDSASQISSQPNADAGRHYAMIIGISNYDHWGKNTLAASNARELSKILSDSYGFDKKHIVSLIDATKKKIDSQFNHYLTELKSNDQLFIFFTGHSFQNNKGETFWIPKDGGEKNSKTWVKHSEFINKFLNSKELRAKNVCMVTDSFFISKPLHSSPNPLTIFDLGYEEKLRDLANRKSREIIFPDVNDPFFKEKTGLLSSWFLYALKNNPINMMDMENLFFESNLLPLSAEAIKPAVRRGRLHSDNNGQFILLKAPKKILETKKIIVKTLAATPKKDGVPGEIFTFFAKSSEPAQTIQLKVGKKIYPMVKQTDMEWTFSWKQKTTGKFPTRAMAIDMSGASGEWKNGPVIRIKPHILVKNNISVSPAVNGNPGDTFIISAETSEPAEKALIEIDAIKDRMRNITDTKWEYTWTAEKKGNFPIRITPFDLSGNMGKQKRGPTLLIKKISILKLSLTPNNGKTGDEFTCAVETSEPASKVSITVGNSNKKMTRITDTKWRHSWVAGKPGKFPIQALPFDKTGKKGNVSAEKSFIIADSPPSIASITLLPDGAGTPGKALKIIIRTNKPANRMDVAISGQQQKIKKNTNAEWECAWTPLKQGIFRVSAIPYGKNNVRGKSLTKEIAIKSLPEIASMDAVVDGATVTFKGTVNMTVSGVTLVFESEDGQVDRHEMEPGGHSWVKVISLKKEGRYSFYMTPKTRNGDIGPPSKKKSFMIVRWKGNGDGTVTDVITKKIRDQFEDKKNGSVFDYLNNILWEMYPKTLPVDYKDAVGYCSELKQSNYSIWRLPTKEEWLTFVDTKHDSSTSMDSPFKNPATQFHYWSQTEYNPSSMYTMNLYINKIGRQKKQRRMFVWCVRNPDEKK